MNEPPYSARVQVNSYSFSWFDTKGVWRIDLKSYQQDVPGLMFSRFYMLVGQQRFSDATDMRVVKMINLN